MPKFDSPLGSKKFAGQPMQEFDVPDETGSEYPEEYAPMNPVMRRQRPAPHGQQPPTDIGAAIAFQNRMQAFQNESPEDSMEVERQIREARDAKRTGKERLNDGAKRRIEMLIGVTRTTRDVDLEGNVFVLQTLRSKEMREALMAASEFDNSVQFPFEMRRQFLARSLTQVAGIEIAQFVGSNTLEARLQLIDDLPEALLNRLYDEYTLLTKESTDKFAIKNENDALEVGEDLKK